MAALAVDDPAHRGLAAVSRIGQPVLQLPLVSGDECPGRVRLHFHRQLAASQFTAAAGDEILGPDGLAVDQPEHQPLGKGPPFLDQVAGQGRPARQDLVQRAAVRVEPGALHAVLHLVGEQGVHEREQGIDRVERRPPVATGETEQVVADEQAESAEIEPRAVALHAAQFVQAGRLLALVAQGPDLGADGAQFGDAQLRGAPQEQAGLVVQLLADNGRGHPLLVGRIAQPQVLVPAQGRVAGVVEQQAGAEPAVHGHEHGVDVVFDQKIEHRAADRGPAGQGQLLEAGGRDGVQHPPALDNLQAITLLAQAAARLDHVQGLHAASFTKTVPPGRWPFLAPAARP